MQTRTHIPIILVLLSNHALTIPICSRCVFTGNRKRATLRKKKRKVPYYVTKKKVWTHLSRNTSIGAISKETPHHIPSRLVWNPCQRTQHFDTFSLRTELKWPGINEDKIAILVIGWILTGPRTDKLQLKCFWANEYVGITRRYYIDVLCVVFECGWEPFKYDWVVMLLVLMKMGIIMKCLGLGFAHSHENMRDNFNWDI